MAEERTGKKIELEPNSKPFLFKRIISDGFDTVLIFLVFMLFSTLIFSSPLAKTYNGHVERYREIENSALEEFPNDADAVKESLGGNTLYGEEKFAAKLHGYLLMLLAGLVAEAAVLLAVPMISPARATPGKILTKIMPFDQRKQSKASRLAIFGRFLFVFIIDSAFLFLWTELFTFLLVPVLRLTEMLLNKKNRTVCDVLTGVTIIEKLSYNGIDNV